MNIQSKFSIVLVGLGLAAVPAFGQTYDQQQTGQIYDLLSADKYNDHFLTTGTYQDSVANAAAGDSGATSTNLSPTGVMGNSAIATSTTNYVISTAQTEMTGDISLFNSSATPKSQISLNLMLHGSFAQSTSGAFLYSSAGILVNVNQDNNLIFQALLTVFGNGTGFQNGIDSLGPLSSYETPNAQNGFTFNAQFQTNAFTVNSDPLTVQLQLATEATARQGWTSADFSDTFGLAQNGPAVNLQSGWGASSSNFGFHTNAVPEPTAMTALELGLLLLSARRKR